MTPWRRYHSWVKSLNRIQRFMLAVVEWSLLGCLVAGLFFWYQQRPLSAPTSLGNHIESPYFQIYTDLADGQAEFYATFFNEFYRYFESEYFPIEQKKKLKVFLFESPSAYRKYVEKKIQKLHPVRQLSWPPL